MVFYAVQLCNFYADIVDSGADFENGSSIALNCELRF